MTVFHFKSTTNESATSLYKLSCQKPMFMQIEWEVQNGLVTKNGLLPLITYCFKSLIWALEPLIKSCFNVPMVQIYTFILFVSASVLLEGVFSLRVPLNSNFNSFTFFFNKSNRLFLLVPSWIPRQINNLVIFDDVTLMYFNKVSHFPM